MQKNFLIEFDGIVLAAKGITGRLDGRRLKIRARLLSVRFGRRKRINEHVGEEVLKRSTPKEGEEDTDVAIDLCWPVPYAIRDCRYIHVHAT